MARMVRASVLVLREQAYVEAAVIVGGRFWRTDPSEKEYQGNYGDDIGRLTFDLVELSRRVPWEVAVLDYNMPGKNGLELIKELRQRYPGRAVLILSMYPEDRYAVRALKAGAAGYLTKESAPEELVSAIRKVAGGGRYVTPTLGEKLALELEDNRGKPLHETLSDREYQVMWMIASGKTVRQIADELGGDSELAEHIKVLTRTHQSMIWSRQRQTNALRSMLREFYPAALTAFPELNHSDALAVLASAPTPSLGRQLSISKIAAALRRGDRPGPPVAATPEATDRQRAPRTSRPGTRHRRHHRRRWDQRHPRADTPARKTPSFR